MAAASAVSLLVVVGLFYFFNQRAVSPRHLSNEAAKLKQANAAALSRLNAGQTLPVKEINADDYIWQKGAGAELIVYLDFDCPFSREYWRTLKSARAAFGKQLTIVLRHYPVDSHPNAVLAAQAFECGREQGQAEGTADALFDNQVKNDNNRAGILAAADQLGLDNKKFVKCLDSEKYRDKIAAQKEEAGLFGVIGAPTSFLNGRNLPGAYQFEDFTDATGRQYSGLRNMIKKELKIEN